jgi:hypothetical protein
MGKACGMCAVGVEHTQGAGREMCGKGTHGKFENLLFYANSQKHFLY